MLSFSDHEEGTGLVAAEVAAQRLLACLQPRPLAQVNLVVIHCTELPDMATARIYGERVLHASGAGNSGHYYIDRDGRVHRFVPPSRSANHTRGYNPRSVGIELVELTTRARERLAEADRLRFGLEEVEAVDPQPGEAAALAVEEARLGSADSLREAADTARNALLGDDADPDEGRDATGLVAAARAALEQSGVEDPDLVELVGRLRELGYLLADVGADLSAYGAGVETDPARLAVVQERRAAVTRLVRKYGMPIDGADRADRADRADGVDASADGAAAVLAWAQQAAVRLDSLEGDDDRIATLRARRDELLAILGERAAEVSAARRSAAARFSGAVTEELAALAMPNAAVDVAVDQTETAESGLLVGERRLAFGRHGVDDVEMLLRPHAGAPSRALQRGASGGELSRVMLAVEVVFAGADPVPTLVFDEVDAGVGGKAAVEGGRRLAALARTSQVIVVTHLPQVAAFADQHLVVRKSDDGAVTRSGVVALDDAGRLKELSRMLAGLEESSTARAHARELLDAATKDKLTLVD